MVDDDVQDDDGMEDVDDDVHDDDDDIDNVDDDALALVARLAMLFLQMLFPHGSVPTSGQWEKTESVTLHKRLIPIIIVPFWKSHAQC